LSRSSVLERKRKDTLGLEVELDLEATSVTVYCPGLQWRRPVVDSDVVFVELPTAAVRAGIGAVLRLLALMTNFGSRATYKHCTTGAHYPMTTGKRLRSER
jgi:hypothetical protein